MKFCSCDHSDLVAKKVLIKRESLFAAALHIGLPSVSMILGDIAILLRTTDLNGEASFLLKLA